MSSVINDGVDALVKRGIYSTKNELIEDALRGSVESWVDNINKFC